MYDSIAAQKYSFWQTRSLYIHTRLKVWEHLKPPMVSNIKAMVKLKNSTDSPCEVQSTHLTIGAGIS
jgi:hypothetical protein